MNSITIGWNSQSLHNTMYTVQINDDSSWVDARCGPESVLPNHCTVKASAARVTGLKQNTAYRFRVNTVFKDVKSDFRPITNCRWCWNKWFFVLLWRSWKPDFLIAMVGIFPGESNSTRTVSDSVPRRLYRDGNCKSYNFILWNDWERVKYFSHFTYFRCLIMSFNGV